MDLINEKNNNKDVENCEFNKISKIGTSEDESNKIETGLVFNN